MDTNCMSMKIIDLFPTPIGIFKNTDTSEHKFMLESKFIDHPYYDNFIVSKESNFLNKNKVPLLYDFITQSLNEYSKTTLATNQTLKFTQSWLTKHDGIEQYTFPHKHQNSIISGCYYVLATEQDAGINFHREQDGLGKYINWVRDKDLYDGNKYAYEKLEINVETGVLVLFPSQLMHSVYGGFKDSVRCSLAFNTWFNGPIGSKDAFTLL